jgi:Tat protein translocase TatB subunit
MIDLGLSKLAVIGVVALIVIGPEKLPKVARMAGTLYGRAQRYLHEVKSRSRARSKWKSCATCTRKCRKPRTILSRSDVEQFRT